MAFVSEMVDQLRVFLNDTGDTQVSFATKKLFLNRGIQVLWPAIYRITETTIAVTTADSIYALPIAVTQGLVLSVELRDSTDNDDYLRLANFDVIAGDEDTAGYIRLGRRPTSDSALLRIRYATPISQIAAATYVAAQSEVWVGPDRALNLPVLYAMAMITSAKIDDRQDHTRYSTTQAANGTADSDILTASSAWLNQYYAELEQLTRPLPPTRD